MSEIQITYELTAEYDDLPLEGNLIDSGDRDADREYEQEVRDRLARGDVWAWAYVSVTGTAHVNGRKFTATAGLGGCCYHNEADFRACEAESLETEVRQDILEQIERRNAELRVPSYLLSLHRREARGATLRSGIAHTAIETCTCQLAADYRVIAARLDPTVRQKLLGR